MSPRDRAVLEHLARGEPLAALLARQHRGTVYRILRRLRRRGFVAPGDAKGEWRVTPEGARVLEGEAAAGAPPMGLPALPIPHLALTPSEAHRAALELAVLAGSVRRHRERHHASLVLVSGPLKGKSWMLEAACLALGAAPATSVLHAGAETAGSLRGRRNARGEVLALRAALASPVLALDEWLRAPGEVRRAAQVLLHGAREVPLEEQTLLVRAVILLAGNPPEGATELEERTGLDPAMIRRAFVVDLDAVELDEGFRRDGEERLERLRALGPVNLPDVVAREDDQYVRDRVAALLDEVLDGPERVASVDVVLLAQLVQDARLFGLDLQDALALVVRDACVLWATTRWVRADWQERLRRLLPARPGERCNPEAPAPPGTGAAAAEVESAYDYDARLARLDAVARGYGLGDPEALDAALASQAALAAAGVRVRPENAPGVAELLRRARGRSPEEAEARLALLAALDELRLGARDAERAARLVVAAGAALGLDERDAVAFASEAAHLGLDPQELACWVAAVVRNHGRLERDLERHSHEAEAARLEAAERSAEVEAHTRRVARLLQVLERAGRDPVVRRALRVADDELGRESISGAIARLRRGLRAPC